MREEAQGDGFPRQGWAVLRIRGTASPSGPYMQMSAVSPLLAVTFGSIAPLCLRLSCGNLLDTAFQDKT